MIEVCILFEIARLFFMTDWSYRDIASYLSISHQSVSRFVTKLKLYGIVGSEVKGMNPLQFEKLLAKKEKIYLKEKKEKEKDSGNQSAEGKIHPNYKQIAKQKIENKGQKGKPSIKMIAEEHIKQFGKKSVSLSTIYNGVKKAMLALQLTLTQIFVPGRNLHVDFAGKQLFIGPKEKIRLSFIVGALAVSKSLFVKATFTQKQSDWLEFIEYVFVLLGKKTLFVITDNAPPLVKTPKPNLQLTDGYRDFCHRWDVIADPAPPRSPNYNQPAEQGVKIFTDEIFPVLEACDFNKIEEVQAKINELLISINSRPISGSTYSRNDLLATKELPAMKTHTNELSNFPLLNRQFTVDKRYRYKFEGVYYSVPYKLFGKKIHVDIHKTRLVFKLKGQTIWTHERKQEGEGHSIVLKHMPPNHRNLMKQDRFYFRNWAKEIDPTFADWVDAQYEGLPDFDFYGRAQCRAFQKLFAEYLNKGMEGEFLTTVDLCLKTGRTDLNSLNTLLHDEIAEDDDALEIFNAYFAAKAMQPKGEHYVH